MRAAVLAFCLLPAAALACPGELLLSCPIGSRQLEVCLTAEAVSYSFGPKGAPELSLSTPLRDAEYTPWPGVGREIWDSLAFRNKGITYEVWTSADRGAEGPAGRSGGVNVLEGETLVAQLTCAPGTVTGDLSAVFPAKEALGQCWNFTAKAWADACP